MSTEHRPAVLVVDDDALVRRPLELILQKEGFDTAVASNGAECLACLEASPPELIILDVMMPGIDGFAVCHAIKQDPRWTSIPIVLLSARAQPMDRERGLGLGAADYVTKPYVPADLVALVRRLLPVARKV